jgi:hypothetical protein
VIDGTRVRLIEEPLAPAGYRSLAEELEQFTDGTLSVSGFDTELARLEFLIWFPNLRRLTLPHLYYAEDLAALQFLPANLEVLEVGVTEKPLDLTPACRFEQIRKLRVVGHRRGLRKLIEQNQSLRALSLWRISRIDRAVPTLPQQLESLAVTLGSIQNVSWLSQCSALRYLALRGTRGLSDLTPLKSLERLEWLWLDGLKKIERLPDLSANRALIRVDLTEMRGLRSNDALQNLAKAPMLREVLVTESLLPSEAFRPLTDHPHLERVGVGLGSERRNRDAQELLALPPQRTHTDFAETHGIRLTF